jgi:hypothetical protein
MFIPSRREARKESFLSNFLKTLAPWRPFDVAQGILCAGYFNFFFAYLAFFAVNYPDPNPYGGFCIVTVGSDISARKTIH